MSRDISRSRLLNFGVTDYVWADKADTSRYSKSFADDFTQHTTLAAGNTQTRDARSLGAMYSVQLENSAAVVTTALISQVKVNNRPLFEDDIRPTIAVGATQSDIVRVPSKRHFIRGETISTVIDQVDGLQTGTLTVILKEEPFALVPRDRIVARSARSRFRRDEERDAVLPLPRSRRDLTGRPESLRSASSRQSERVTVATSGGATGQPTSAPPPKRGGQLPGQTPPKPGPRPPHSGGGHRL